MIMQASLENLLNNPFVNHFVDCVENLPNNLQFLLSELRSVDSQVNAHHRKLSSFKENHSNDSNGDAESAISVDQLAFVHNTLLKCQELGDQKVELVGQIIDLLDKKTKQLILDTKTLDDRAFKIEIDEEKIVSEFKATIRHSHRHQNGKEKNFNNIVTKGMSKYISGGGGSYEATRSTGEYRSSSSLGNNNSASLRQKYLNTINSNSSNSLHSSSNRNTNFQQQQLPDRKAKKPRIDEPKSAVSKYENSSTSNGYNMTRSSKRQLNYSHNSATPTFSKSSSNNNNNSLIKKRHTILNHQSSPSSSVSTSSSSSMHRQHTTRHFLQRSSTASKQRHYSNSKKYSKNDDDNENNVDEDDDDSNDDYHQATSGSNNKKQATITEHHSNDDFDDDDNEEPNNNNDDNSSTASSVHSNTNRIKTDVYNNQTTATSVLNNNTNVLSSISNTTASVNEQNEPIYCTCRQISYGQMIGCDNAECELEWFHFDCVKLTSKPKGKWYCPKCRGDSHKVMRKQQQQQQQQQQK